MDGARDLVNALRDADPAETVWSWSEDQSVRHYLRMMPIETAVHRWDAQNAVGPAAPIEARLATYGISHTFEVMAPMRRKHSGQAKAGGGESYLWQTTDTNTSCFVVFSTTGVGLVEAPDHEAGVTVRGSASDLFLYLWGRVSSDKLVTAGDSGLLERYFQLVPAL